MARLEPSATPVEAPAGVSMTPWKPHLTSPDAVTAVAAASGGVAIAAAAAAAAVVVPASCPAAALAAEVAADPLWPERLAD